MRTNERTRPTWSVAVGTLALLATTIGTALAAAPSTTAYRFSSHPMISGTVVTVNDREMVVDTDQGEQVTLQLDSRTMAPRDLAPGMVMRAEFLAQEDCRFYAQRIVPVRGGTSTNRLQAYANTRDSRETIDRNASAFGGGYRAASTESQPVGESRVTEPQTMGEHSNGPIMKAAPTTSDYRFSTKPMVSGRVVSVNDHLLVVETEQGQQVGLIMDSRTMVPGEVAPGSIFRAEFTSMKDGRPYADRIYWIGNGNGVAGREQAYAHTRDSDLVLARNTSDCGCVSAPVRNTVTSAVESPEVVAVSEPVVVATAPAIVVVSAPAPVVETPETLPQTASKQPLIALLGALALAAAGALAIGRRLYTA
jgi:LPXTG-motif cell wall-anchored protein